MISVCLDTTLTTSKCNKYTFRPYDFAPSQAKAFAPHLVNKMGKRWFIAYADYSRGQSTRDAYANEIKEMAAVVGTPRHPARHCRYDAVPVQDQRRFRRAVPDFLRPGLDQLRQPGHRSRASQKYKWAGDGAVAVASQLPALGDKIEGFVGVDRYVPVFDPPLDTPYLHAFYDEAVERLKKAGLENAPRPLCVQSNFEAMNALKLGIEKSKFQGRADPRS
jgi:hypothetical protein